MTETITITNRMIVADLGRPQLTEAQEKELQGRLAAMMDRQIEKAMFGGWPPGYDPGKGMPGTLYLGRPPRCCYGSVIHAPNCKSWGGVT